jgi:microcystin-dependent protein
MTESIGRQYETAIPSLSDTANIQEAFRIYHYGRPTTEFNPTNTEPTDLEPKSVAYYLNNFQDQINDINSTLSPTAYEKRGNLLVAGDEGPIVLELNPFYPTFFSQNGLVLTSDDGEDSGMKWQAPSITSTNFANLANKKIINSTVSSDGLKFDDSATLHTTTLRSPSQASSKTIFFPTSAAVMPGTSTTLVATDTTQTLTNKTITGPTISDANISNSTVDGGGDVVGTTATQTLTNKTLTSAVMTGGGAVVGTTATQTLTNKTINLEAASNTITGRLASTSGGTPAGVISQYAGSSAPAGYLLCQGQSESTTLYADLFNAIGYTYGGSGGSFNIPDLRTRIPVGRSNAVSLGTATISIASPAVVTDSNHGLSNGQVVYFTTTGTLPTNITANTRYFVRSAAANTFSISATQTGALINTSGTQSGTHTLFSANFDAMGQSSGLVSQTLSINEMPSHTHSQIPHNHTQDPHNHSATSNTAGSHSHDASTDIRGGHTHADSGSHNHESFNGVPVTRVPGVGDPNSQDRIISTISRQVTTSTTHTHSNQGSHSHEVTIDSGGSHSHTITVNNKTATNQETTAINQDTGGGLAHTNLQPYIVLNYIIKT